MRSNSHILGHLTETVGSVDALSVGSLNNEQNLQYGHSKQVTEQNIEMSSSQDASKRYFVKFFIRHFSIALLFYLFFHILFLFQVNG